MHQKNKKKKPEWRLDTWYAKLRPTQFEGPTEKGINAAVLWITSFLPNIVGSRAICFSVANHRSGINVSGKGEKYRGS
jgi:hypothetical protein